MSREQQLVDRAFEDAFGRNPVVLDTLWQYAAAEPNPTIRAGRLDILAYIQRRLAGARTARRGRPAAEEE